MIQQNSASPASPDVPPALSYLVGQDAEGHWLAIEEHGRGGGFFVSKVAALRYVSFETSRAPGRCHMACAPIDLSFGEAAHDATVREAA